MGESVQVRLQQDIVDEINEYDGGSFSERFRAWKNDKLSGCDNSVTVDDVDDAVSRAIKRDLPEMLQRLME